MTHSPSVRRCNPCQRAAGPVGISSGPDVPDDGFVALPSFMSVFIRAVRPLLANPAEMGEIIQGTGFVLRHQDRDYLITNGHIVTGRSRVGDAPLGCAALPTHLEVALPMSGSGFGTSDLELLGLSRRRLELYDEDGRARWFIHPTFRRVADVVALPLDEDGRMIGPGERITLMPYSLGPSDPSPTLEPTTDLSVVGFPFGFTGGAGSAIWVRGTIASEPDLPFLGEPCFLVDARSRDGQSGSPVIQFSPGSTGGMGEADTPPSWPLIGVYSGRITLQSDLGRVWRWTVLKTIVESRIRDTLGPDD